MKTEQRDTFIQLWKKYFGNAELPVAFYYSNEKDDVEIADKPKGHSCFICELAKVRNGKSLAFDDTNIGCAGGRRYVGFTDTIRPGFEYFLSHGNEQMEGERYIRTPEMVKDLMKNQQHFNMSGKCIIFKRWDQLNAADEPEVVIFFASPDVLSGLFTLANFDQTDPNTTIAPFGSGCSSIVHHPMAESRSGNPRAIIGMFDPSARPCVPSDVITFAVPMKRFEKMISNMEESFLITDTWKTIRERISKS